jgi:nucleolar protein 14
MGSKKGSQLRRFKESLSSITSPGELRKKKKKQAPFKDVDRNDKLKNIEEQFNKFGTKFQRAKYPVFGRKVKGQTGKYEASKELAEQKVCPVLVPESSNMCSERMHS